MYAKVCHSAHCSALLVEEPGVLTGADGPGLGAAVAEGACKADDLADFSGINQLLGLHVSLSKALVLSDHQALAAFFGSSQHSLALFQSDSHGLFTENVLAGLQSLDGQLCVSIVCSANRNCIDFRVCKHLFSGGVNLTAVFCSHVFSSLCIRAEITVQLTCLIGSVFRNMSNLGYLTAAHNAYFQHGSFSFRSSFCTYNTKISSPSQNQAIGFCYFYHLPQI